MTDIFTGAMGEGSSQLLFGKLHFQTKLSHFNIKSKSELLQHRKKVLLKAINSDVDISKELLLFGAKEYVRDMKWRFGGVKVGTEPKNHIYGKLGKETPQTTLKWDSRTKDYVPDEMTMYNVAVFLIDLDKNILVFESKQHLGRKALVKIIKNIFNAVHKGKEHLEIEPIVDKREVVKRLKKLSIVSSISLNVHPSNPDSTFASDKMDSWLRKANITALNLKANSDKKGMKLDQAELIESGISLAQEGYGHGVIMGKIGGKSRKIITGNYPIKKEASIHAKDDDLNIKILIHQIKETLRILEEKSDETL